MKLKWLIAIIFTTILTAFNYSEKYGFLSPALKISYQIDKQRKFMSFALNINSTNPLESITISIYTKNKLLKTTTYDLQGKKRAFITYYYFVNKNLPKEQLTFIFSVKDKKTQRKFIKEIFL